MGSGQRYSLIEIGNQINKIMQKIQSNLKTAQDLFSPWDDDREMELVAINSVMYEAQKQQRWRNKPPRVPKFSKELATVTIQDEAKKTLLHVEQTEKSKKMQFLKDYVDRKKQSSQKMEADLPQGFNNFKLPPIHKRKSTLEVDQNSKKVLQDTLNQLIDNTAQVDNQEQLIFRKYGEHKKKKTNVERSLSFGYHPIRIMNVKSDFQKKYDTLQSSSVRQKRSSEAMLAELKLKGKKYSCEIRTNRSNRNNRIDSISYIPTQPKITPHYMLFGHNKEDVMKKVLQQLQHKFKQSK